LREVQELPALKLRAIRKVRVLCQGVVLPAARFVNHFPAPHSRRSVEIEKRSAPGPCAVFDNEVPVEQDRFHVGQQGIVAVQVSPARKRSCSTGTSLSNTAQDRKSTRLNSSHVAISYAVFCLKKK